jgi:hypothetical protein
VPDSPADPPVPIVDTAAFRERAAECVELAKGAKTEQQRALLLAMAQKWVELADQAQKIQSLLDSDAGQDWLKSR